MIADFQMTLQSNNALWLRINQDMCKLSESNKIMASALVYQLNKKEVSWVWAGHKGG